MTDDHAFHLTPLDVRSQEFARTLRGYDRAQVDEFKLAISEELERLLRDRAQHEERLRSLQEQLRAFRDRERAMNEALVAAQQFEFRTATCHVPTSNEYQPRPGSPAAAPNHAK